VKFAQRRQSGQNDDIAHKVGDDIEMIDIEVQEKENKPDNDVFQSSEIHLRSPFAIYFGFTKYITEGVFISS
jgi:hypothetical protein